MLDVNVKDVRKFRMRFVGMNFRTENILGLTQPFARCVDGARNIKSFLDFQISRLTAPNHTDSVAHN